MGKEVNSEADVGLVARGKAKTDKVRVRFACAIYKYGCWLFPLASIGGEFVVHDIISHFGERPISPPCSCMDDIRRARLRVEHDDFRFIRDQVKTAGVARSVWSVTNHNGLGAGVESVAILYQARLEFC